ncbi:MAG: sugar phosphate isomerase/epimerase [Gemmatimonadota bacterium]
MERRAFVGHFAAAAFGVQGLRWSGAAFSAAPASSRRLPSVGLELYSVRDAMRGDPEGTMAAVRAMGYADVEVLWSMGNFGRTARQVRAALDNTGLRATSAHISPGALLEGWDRSLEMAHEIGHQTLVVPSFSEETSRTLDDWKRWADRFNTAGEKARRANLWLAMHNEPEHQRPVDGRIPFELFVASTDPRYVHIQLDVGNMVIGGGDPMNFLTRFAPRCWSFHIKDVVADRSADTELGTGSVDLGAILAAIPDLEHKTCFVEQEGATDPMASAKRDFDYLSRLEF